MIEAGLIGASISGSLTPLMHEAEGRVQGLAYIYRRVDIEGPKFASRTLAEILQWAKDNGFAGLNITHPFKQAVLPFLNHRSDVADALGAANTVLFQNGKLIGDNTDYTAFRRDCERTLKGRDPQRILLAGAGGAGAAIALALVDHGVERLGVLDANKEAAEKLVACLEQLRPKGPACLITNAAADTWDGVVNCTPMGMSDHPGMAIDPANISGLRWVQDIVYFPLKTRLLAEAEALGLETFTGAGLAIGQAADSFRLFTGREPVEARMRDTFLTHIKEQTIDA